MNSSTTEHNELMRWKKQAGPHKWEVLASLAGTSTGYLNQLAYGFRRASAEKAMRISQATKNWSDPEPVAKEALVFAPIRTKKTLITPQYKYLTA